MQRASIPGSQMTSPGGAPLVSVVMIFRDAERFFVEAVQSVLGQSFSDIELLLVDDGSTDRSTGAAHEFSAQFPGVVRVLEHPGHANKGMSASRNLGLVCGRAMKWRSWDGSGSRDDWSPLPFAPHTVISPPHMLTAVLRRGAYSIPMCSLLVRAEILRSVGGAEEHFRGMFEDQVLLAKLHLTAASVIDGGLTARYRQHCGSSTAVAQRDGSYHPSDP